MTKSELESEIRILKDKLSDIQERYTRMIDALNKASEDRKILKSFLEDPVSVAEMAAFTSKYNSESGSLAYFDGYYEALNAVKTALKVEYLTDEERENLLTKVDEICKTELKSLL